MILILALVYVQISVSKYMWTWKNDRTNMKNNRVCVLSERGRAAKIRNVVAVNWTLNKKNSVHGCRDQKSVIPITVFLMWLTQNGFSQSFHVMVSNHCFSTPVNPTYTFLLEVIAHCHLPFNSSGLELTWSQSINVQYTTICTTHGYHLNAVHLSHDMFRSTGGEQNFRWIPPLSENWNRLLTHVPGWRAIF